MNSSFLHSLLSFSVPTFVSAAISLAMIFLMSHWLPAGDYAKVNLFYDYGMLVSLLCLLGTDGAYLRFFFSGESNKQARWLFSSALLTGLTVLCFCAIVVFVVYRREILADLFSANNIFLFCLFLYTVALIVFRLTSSTARLESDVKRYSFIQISYLLINRFLFCLPLLIFGGFESGIVFMTLAMLLLSGVALISEPKPVIYLKECHHDIPYLKVLKYGLPGLLLGVLLNLINAIDKTFIITFCDAESAGIFSMGIVIASMFSFISGAFSTYWSVYVYSHYEQQQKMIQLMHDFVMLISVLFMVVIFVFQDLIYALIGVEYKSSQSFFLLLMLWPIQAFVSETTAYGINLSNKTYFNFVASLIALLINVVGCLVLVRSCGVAGVAISFGVSGVVLLILRTVFAQNFYRMVASPLRSALSLLFLIGISLVNLFGVGTPIERFAIVLIVLCVLYLAYFKQIFLFKTYFQKVLQRSHE